MYKCLNKANSQYRCWLLRLGFIGDEFKNCKKHLMKALDGDCAFRAPGMA